jgi:hypothetical protein
MNAVELAIISKGLLVKNPHQYALSPGNVN